MHGQAGSIKTLVMFPVLGRPHEVIKVPVSLFQKLFSMFLPKMDLTAAKNAFASQIKTANNFSYLLCPSLVPALYSFQYKKITQEVESN